MTTRNKTVASNGSFVLDQSNIPELITALPTIKTGGIGVGMEAMEESMEQRFDQRGPGWPAKGLNFAEPGEEPSGRARSPLGMDDPGQTPALREAIEGRLLGPEHGAVGYMTQEKHPHPGIFGRFRESSVPSITDVAIAHEFGVAEDGSVVAPGKLHWTAEGGGTGSPVFVPARPIVSLSADKDGRKALGLVRGFLHRAVGAFNTLPRVD